MNEYVGWAATVVFVMSYFCGRIDVLRRVQMVGAAMWIVYGILMQALPIIAANLLVLLAAAWTAWRPSPVPQASASIIESGGE